MGDFAFPCFSLSKVMKKSPQKIAEEIVAKSLHSKVFSEIKVLGPYVNFYLNKNGFIKSVFEEVLNWSKSDFHSMGKGKTVVIDFSSPNIAKPFSIAHLRSTSIGNSLSHIYEYLGYKVIRINHLGDWGTSFGKLIVAYKLWGSAEDLEKYPIKKLLELYVRFHKEAKANPELEEEGKGWFKKLEDGNKEAVKLWSWFKELSLKEFNRMYELIGVRFDYYWGESYYQDKIDKTLNSMKELLSESQGALIVDLTKYDMPPLLLKKQDGATLYATRDIAASIYRWEQFSFDEMIYVVGGEQELHFKQFFKVLELMNYKWVNRCSHIGFGLIQFKDGKMSTREGKIIFLEDVIEKAKELALEKINETESEKTIEERLNDKEKEERALKIGISSVIFSDLKNGRMKDILFDWDEMLNTKGETGIYLQYAHARLCGILRNFEKRIGPIVENKLNITEDYSFDIAKELYLFNDRLVHAVKVKEPSVIARYLLDLGQSFSSYYRANQVINDNNPELSQERVLTVLAVKKVLSDGLKLLGIEPLDRM
ncbi:MAG: arginine--tRNA ligase, partial [Spirochaetota bacterium]|nr:arginine--tRNA ligase [Spirochaetota bacterium]